MAEAIILIIKFDSIFQDSQLTQIWPQYVSVIKLAEQNIDILTSKQTSNEKKYMINDIDGLKNALSKIDFLLSGHLLQVIVIQIYNMNASIYFWKLSLFFFNKILCKFLYYRIWSTVYRAIKPKVCHYLAINFIHTFGIH